MNYNSVATRAAVLAVTILLFMSVSAITLVILPATRAVTLYVGGSGSDNYTRIQDAIDAANRGSRIYVYNGTYSEDVVVNKALSLVGEDRDATIVNGSGTQDVVRVTADWVNITSFMVTGGGVGNPPFYYAGIALHYVENCSISNNNVSYNDLTGIGLSYSNSSTIIGNVVSQNDVIGIRVYFSNENMIIDNAVFSNNQTGIGLGYSNNNTVRNNTASGNRWYGVSLGGSPSIGGFSNTVSGNVVSNSVEGFHLGGYSDTISNNTIFNNTHGILMEGAFYNLIAGNDIAENNGEGILVWAVSSFNTIADNTIAQNGACGISVESFSVGNNTIERNDIIGNNFGGISIMEGYDYIIRDNDIVNNADGIVFGGSNHKNLVSGNKILWNSGPGIFFGPFPSSDNYVSGNNISSNNGAGISLSSSNTTVTNNYVVSNFPDGIALELFSNNNTIVNNNISSGFSGVVIQPFSRDNLVANNVMWSNTMNGMLLLSALSNTITKNEVSSNFYGINVESSSSNLIHHNNIVDNTIQALDDLSGNDWDNGYPSGGNYWSDYAGVDQKSGPNQDQLGSDGIGDTPYVIDADSQDRYPLIDPTDCHPPEILDVLINGKPSQTYSIEDIPELNLTAIIDDRESGSSSIDGANYTMGLSNWSSSIQMNPLDGAFDSSYERVFAELMPPSEARSYYYCVYAWDVEENSNITSTACAELKLLVFPSRPLMVDSVLAGRNFENVTILWNRSGDDGAGENDIIGYDIYRSTNYTGPYEVVGNVPANGSLVYEWTCVDCGEGDPNNYFFYVEANDSVLSRPSPNMVGKFTRPLMQGPNLVSIPLIRSNESVETVLQTVKYDKAWSYDSSSQEWKWHMKHKGYRRALLEMNHTMGIWVNVTEDSNFTVAGIVPAQTTIHLYQGWNLVSFPSFDATYTVAALKVEIGATRAEGYDFVPPYYLRALGDTEMLLAGEAYWVRVDADVDWIVEVS